MSQFLPDGRAELIGVAHALADAAGAAILPHFRSSGLSADNKDADGGFDPVTQGDRAGEAAMRAVLADLRPRDGIFGEEEGRTEGETGLTWVLDPIDGTRAFVSGMITWGVLIGLDAGDGPVLGVVDQPYVGERFVGGFGKAEFRRHDGEAQPIRTRDCAGLSDAILYTTFPEIGTTGERLAFERVRDRAHLTRYGTDCYAYALIAAGQVDIVVEAGLLPYDIQGPMAVIEGAGGIVTDWQGGPADQGGRILAAGDRRVHAEALELLNAG